jgi:hypothetical protein
MLQDLIVKQGTHVILDEKPPQAIAGALQRVNINTLQDLVDVGAVRSHDALDKLLHAAHTATASAIRLRETYTPMVRVHGTMLPDLRRFGAFRAAAPEVPSSDVDIFWRVVREIDPVTLATMTPATNLSSILRPSFGSIFKYLFKDVEVQSNSVLTLTPAIHVFLCNHLTICKGGKIAVQGSGMVINAFSIQGNV